MIAVSRFVTRRFRVPVFLLLAWLIDKVEDVNSSACVLFACLVNREGQKRAFILNERCTILTSNRVINTAIEIEEIIECIKVLTYLGFT